MLIPGHRDFYAVIWLGIVTMWVPVGAAYDRVYFIDCKEERAVVDRAYRFRLLVPYCG
jgi:hypothetical protein